jgi:hypothetical protein
MHLRSENLNAHSFRSYIINIFLIIRLFVLSIFNNIEKLTLIFKITEFKRKLSFTYHKLFKIFSFVFQQIGSFCLNSNHVHLQGKIQLQLSIYLCL